MGQLLNMQNEDEAIKALIYDNVNVTEENQLKEFFKILVQLLIYIVIIYFSVFLFSGIAIKTLSLEKQIQFENFITNLSSVKTMEISDSEKNRLLAVRDTILRNDPQFPKTSKLDIGVINNEELNALCFPNGNIYITDKLYKQLDSDEKLLFVLAHEMAHYKNRDHLMNLRKTLSSSMVLLSLCVVGADANNLSKIVSESMDLADYKFSRNVETRADKYAAKQLLSLYGDVKAGVEVMNILKSGDYNYSPEIFSTHPNIDKRIKYLNNLRRRY